MVKIVRQDPSASQAPFPDPLPGIISFGSINLLAGASGVGKTCLTAWLLTRFRDGTPIFGRTPNIPAKIAYLSADRGWASTRVWLDRVGYGDLAFYSLTDDANFALNKLENVNNRRASARTAVLRDCLEQLGLIPNSLVVIDPIALFLGGDLNNYDTCAIALIGIRRLCREFGITIIGLAHASKQKADKRDQYKRLQDRILGSAAQHGYGDTQMYLASPEETGKQTYTFLWHPHLSEAQTFALERDPKTGLFLSTYDADHPFTENEERILASIDNTPEGTAYGAILKACSPPMDENQVYRCTRDLLHAGWLLQPKHGRYRRAKVN